MPDPRPTKPTKATTTPAATPPRRPTSDAELAALAAITPNDVAKARAAWELDAPTPFRRLLDAKDDGTGGTPS